MNTASSATSAPSSSCSARPCSSTPSSCSCRSSGRSATRSSTATRSSGSRSSASTTSSSSSTTRRPGTRCCFTLKYAVVLTIAAGRARLRPRAALRLLAARRRRALVRTLVVLPGRPADRRGRAAVPAAVRGRAADRPGQRRSSTASGIDVRRLVRHARRPRSGSSSSWTSGGRWASTPCCSTPASSTSPRSCSSPPASTAPPGWQLVRHIVLPLSLPVLLSSHHLQHQRHAQGLRLRRRADQRRPGQRHDAADALHVPDRRSPTATTATAARSRSADDPVPARHPLHLPLLAPRPDEGLTHDRHDRIRHGPAPRRIHARRRAAAHRAAHATSSPAADPSSSRPAHRRDLPAGLAAPRARSRRRTSSSTTRSGRCPRTGRFDNYVEALTTGNLGTYVRNSIIAVVPVARRSSCCSASPPASRSR